MVDDALAQDDARSMQAHRDQLLHSIARWRLELEGPGGRGTAWLGIADRASKRATAMLMLAVAELVPDFELSGRTTPGRLYDALEHAGPTLSGHCTGRPGRLLRPSDLKVLSDLTRGRNWLAHLEEKAGIRQPDRVGRLETTEVLGILDAAEAFCHLALIDDVICRQRQAPPGRRRSEEAS